MCATVETPNVGVLHSFKKTASLQNTHKETFLSIKSDTMGFNVLQTNFDLKDTSKHAL